MSAKPGRNDPCPCGSGRKFKHCCGAAAVEPPETLAWRRIRRLLEESNPELQRFTVHAYGPEALDEAWREFMSFAVAEQPFSPESPHLEIFMSWFHNFWSPAPDGSSVVREKALLGVEPVGAYLLMRGARLDPMLCEYLESCLSAPLSFHRVEQVDPGKGFTLKDLVTGGEHAVSESSASKSTRPGDIVFAQVVQAGGLWLLECCAGFVFPPIAQIQITDACRRLVGRRKKASFPLRDYDLEMLEIYHAVVEPLVNPRLPTMQNTDGEPFSMRKVVFDIDSAERAFEALRPLDPGDDADLALAQERDASGRLVKAELSWVEPLEKPRAGMSNRVLAFVRIEGSRLVAEVNSEARERRLRGVVEKALGPAARYRATEIQSLEQAMKEAGSRERTVPPRAIDDALLAESPEVQAILDEHMTRHYEDWVSERIPALGNRTPMQAMKTAAGRDAVEALVMQIERDSARMHPPMNPGIVRRLRERLGLKPGTSS